MRLRRGDPQKEPVYAAEDAAGLWGHERFPSFDDLAEWVCACMSSRLVEERFPRFMEHKIRDDASPGAFDLRLKNKNAKTSSANASGIAMHPRQLYKHVALHELAHVITDRQFGRYAEGHGWQWCSVYLTLLGWFTTREIEAHLREEFEARGIAYTFDQAVPSWKQRIVSAAA